MSSSMTAARLYESIEATHSPPEWCVFSEVVVSTLRGERRADAVALNLWPSRGMTIRAFEIKVDKRDLDRELKNPEKAEAIARFADEFWLVTPDGLVPDLDALPPTWGLMVPGPKGGLTLRVAKKAERLSPQEPTKKLLVSLVRAAHERMTKIERDHIPRTAIKDETEKAFRRGLESAPGYQTRFRQEAERLEKRVEDFKTATGIDISNFDAASVTQAFVAGRALVHEWGRGVPHALYQIETAAHDLEKCRKALKGLLEGKCEMEGEG